MQGSRNNGQNIERVVKSHRRRSIWKRVVTPMMAVVVFCTAYALILPAITATKATISPDYAPTATTQTASETVAANGDSGTFALLDESVLGPSDSTEDGGGISRRIGLD